MRAFDVTDKLAAIDAPTLLIYGQDDPLASPDTGRRIAAAIPDAQLEVIPHARHGVAFEYRDVTAGLVRDFVQGHRVEPTVGRQ